MLAINNRASVKDSFSPLPQPFRGLKGSSEKCLVFVISNVDIIERQ
jgi:hypothetical protein